MFGETLEVLCGGGEQELVLGAGEAPEPEALEAHVAFQVGEQHLHFLALIARAFEGLSSGERPGMVTGVFVDVAGDFAECRIGTALIFQRTDAAVAGAGQVAPGTRISGIWSLGVTSR